MEIARGAAVRTPVDILELIVAAFHGRLNVLLEVAETIDRVEDSVFDDVPATSGGPSARCGARWCACTAICSAAGLLRRLEAQAAAERSDGVAAAADRMSHRLAHCDLDVMTLQDRARLLHEEIDFQDQRPDQPASLHAVGDVPVFLLPPP